MKIVFSNEGLLDIRGLKTFGMSAKEGVNPIGYFGTGLKYAIAVILREGGEITVRVGPKEYLFHRLNTSMRGKDFSLVCMNGEELAFTTELGKNWGMVEAFRELYCNAMDESGECRPEHMSTPHSDTRTTIIVKHDAMEKAYFDRDNTILASKPIYVTDAVEFHRGRGNNRIFYRGVHAGMAERATLYTYNLLVKSDLTEDRTLKYSNGSLDSHAARALLLCTDKEILRTCLSARKDDYERHFTFATYWEASPEFYAVIDELHANKILMNNESLWNFLYKNGAKKDVSDYTPTDEEQATLARAIAFCKRMGYTITDYPIVLVEHLGDGILGIAKERKIWISRKNFAMGGCKMLAATLIEEFIHLRFGYEDFSRGFQNHILEQMVTLGEQLLGETL